jgi:hypothetical protein
MDSTGQNSISTLSVRLSRAIHPKISDSDPDGPPPRQEKARHHKERVGHRVYDAVAVIIERDGLAAIAVYQILGVLDHLP